METALKEAMTSGVFVEFCDASGNTLGSTIFTDWRGRPLPAVGDMIGCRLSMPTSDGQSKLRGVIRARHFDLQSDSQGRSCVWVRLLVRVLSAADAQEPRRARMKFSEN